MGNRTSVQYIRHTYCQPCLKPTLHLKHGNGINVRLDRVHEWGPIRGANEKTKNKPHFSIPQIVVHTLFVFTLHSSGARAATRLLNKKRGICPYTIDFPLQYPVHCECVRALAPAWAFPSFFWGVLSKYARSLSVCFALHIQTATTYAKVHLDCCGGASGTSTLLRAFDDRHRQS